MDKTEILTRRFDKFQSAAMCSCTRVAQSAQNRDVAQGTEKQQASELSVARLSSPNVSGFRAFLLQK